MAKGKKLSTIGKKGMQSVSREEVECMEQIVSKPEYQTYAKRAIAFLKKYLEEIDEQLSGEKDRIVIHQISSRIKSAESICRKLKRKGSKAVPENLHMLNDLVGVRVNCIFEDDVYCIAGMLESLEQVALVKKKDYIKKAKTNGYRSLHLIVDVTPDALLSETVRVEIQIRTVAMDCWSILDYQLLYKRNIKGADTIANELHEYSKTIAKLDKRMVRLRKRIEKLCEDVSIDNDADAKTNMKMSVNTKTNANTKINVKTNTKINKKTKKNA